MNNEVILYVATGFVASIGVVVSLYSIFHPIPPSEHEHIEKMEEMVEDIEPPIDDDTA